jgi:ribonuclease J
MKLTIHRGAKEIGGTLIEIKTAKTRILIDAGFPLFLKEKPIEAGISKLPADELLRLGVLPPIEGLYSWDFNDDKDNNNDTNDSNNVNDANNTSNNANNASNATNTNNDTNSNATNTTKPFDAIIISHAHLDHYGLLKYANPTIPVYASTGTATLIELTSLFVNHQGTNMQINNFKMHEPFEIGDIKITPHLMDHSAFDAAAFEITAEGKTILYTGDFRGHGRKQKCLEMFIGKAAQNADVLLTEGTMLGRKNEPVLTETQLEKEIVRQIKNAKGPVLFQASGQNIDRIVSFYRAAIRTGKTFVIDVYTANVLYELKLPENKLPFPSKDYPNIKVFYPYEITQRIFKDIGEKYARRFSSFHMSRVNLKNEQNDIIMAVRPSMQNDLQRSDLKNGLFIYSLWQGYRDTNHQQNFEKHLQNNGFECTSLHTSGHAVEDDIKKLIDGLNPKLVIPVHTMVPEAFEGISDKTMLLGDGVEYGV